MDLPPMRWLQSTVLLPTAVLLGGALAAGVKILTWALGLPETETFASLVAALVMVIALSAMFSAFAGVGHGSRKTKPAEAFFEGSARGGVIGLGGIGSYLAVILAISASRGEPLTIFSGAPAAAYFVLMTIFLMIFVGGIGGLIGRNATASASRGADDAAALHDDGAPAQPEG